MKDEKPSTLVGLDEAELTALALRLGHSAYRGRQVHHGIYRQRAGNLAALSTLPEAFRGSLQDAGYSVGLPALEKKFVSSDGTIRYLLAFADQQSVEAVWMPEGDGGEAQEPGRNFDRATICVSSQAGCAVDCQFCLTALMGLLRNLTAGEIVGQILAVLADRAVTVPQQRINIVFMGMGEPFLNYDNFIKAVRILVQGVGFAESRMTVSTSGIVPRIYDLGQEAVRPKLAISLNASNDQTRTQIMPINRKWNLGVLMDAARAFPLRNRERLFFEYVLLDGINDAPEDARQLLDLVAGVRCKVNLIALNPGPGIAFGTPAAPRVEEFQQILIKGGVPAYIRRPRGRDIFAACGQLKRTVA